MNRDTNINRNTSKNMNTETDMDRDMDRDKDRDRDRDRYIWKYGGRGKFSRKNGIQKILAEFLVAVMTHHVFDSA